MSDARERFDQRVASIARPLSRRIDVAFETDPFRRLKKRFAVATSARTGSYLLCERLLRHGAVMTECFLPSRILSTCRNQDIFRLQNYCERHLSNNTPNGVFGVKGEFNILIPLILSREFPDFLDDWRFIHLRRTDTLKQAISFVIAEMTSSWRSFRKPKRVLTDDDFDAARISNARASLVRMHRIWEETFKLFAIDPLRITYEELAADPSTVTATVAAYLDLKGSPITDGRFVNPPMERQASDLNARWEARFLEEFNSESPAALS